MKALVLRTPGVISIIFLLLGAVLLASCGNSPGPAVYTKAVGRADEASAIQTLRTIATAEAQLKATRGVYGNFDTLTEAGFLDQRFAGTAPNLKGYRFTITPTDSDFSVSADPQTTETQPTTGSRHFYLHSSDNAVHFSTNGPASKTDPVLN